MPTKPYRQTLWIVEARYNYNPVSCTRSRSAKWAATTIAERAREDARRRARTWVGMYGGEARIVRYTPAVKEVS